LTARRALGAKVHSATHRLDFLGLGRDIIDPSRGHADCFIGVLVSQSKQASLRRKSMSPQDRDFDVESNDGGSAMEKISSKAQRVAQRLDDATTRTGRRVESMGRTASDRLTRAADNLAERTESVGGYLQDHDVRAMADDVADVIRRYPVQSLLVGLGMGFMLGRLTTR
jgi:hypothetical protein